MTTVKELKKEHEYFVTERASAANEWQKIANLLMPWQSNITQSSVDGAKKTKHLYDTTGIDAMDKLVSLIVGTATSSVTRWFTAEHNDPELNADYTVQVWMEQVSNLMFEAINRSNYRTEGPAAIRENVGFGIGNVHVEELDFAYSQARGFRGLFFQTVPIGTYTIQEDGLGRVNWTTREMRLPGRELLRRWPNHTMGSESLKEIADNPYKRMDVLHSIYPENKNWRSAYYLKKVRNQEPEQLHEQGYLEFPNLIPRWDKAAGEVWGFGRGHLALPEVATLNRARQLKLRQWALTVHPPLLAIADGVVGKPRIIPGAINRIHVEGALKPFETGMRFDHNAIPETESKLQIRQIFFTEQILQFAPNAKTPPSATEVAQRMEFLHQLLGSSTGRLQDEFLTPMLGRVFNLMYRANVFPPIPEIIKQRGGVLNFTFEGPLARSQRSDELRSVGDTIGIVSNLAAIDPTAWDHHDIGAISRDTPRLTGSSRKYLRSPEAAAQIGKQRQDAQAQAAQQQQMLTGAQTASQLADAQLATAKAGTGPTEPQIS